MGLEDLIPEGKEDTSSRRTQKQKEDTVVFGGGRHRKEFTKERWEEIKSTLINEMGLVPNEVVNNYPAQDRYEALHEAALLSKREISLDELKKQPVRCDICGKAVGDSGVEFEGLTVHINHTMGELQEALK